MEYIPLGRSGLKVSKLCLGTNMFGAGYVEDAQAINVIEVAFSQGINFIDTADAYNTGHSEQVVGKAVNTHRHDFVVATKGFISTGEGPNNVGLSRKHLIDAVEGSLRRLGTEYIDLYQVHYWDPDTPLEETLGTLNDLVKQGKIRYLGCSNFTAWQLIRALWVSDKNNLQRFESIQPEYNFSNRGVETDLFPACEDQDVSIIPFQIFMGGLITGRYDFRVAPPNNSHMASRHAVRAKNTYWNEYSFAIVERLRSEAADLDISIPQLVIAWTLSKPQITSVIVGSSRPTQILDNIGALNVQLPDDVLGRLDCL